MKLSETGRTALRIISKKPGIHITEFAMEMWPDSEEWETTNSKGKNKGYGMIRAGQSYLFRLLKTGWIMEKSSFRGPCRFYITELGKEEIANYKGAQ